MFNLDWFEQPFIFVSSKASFVKLWSEESSYKTISKKAEAAVSNVHQSRCSYKFPDIHKKKKQPPECSVRKGVLRNFAKFKGKHLYQNLFFNKVIINLIKKETLAQVFFCEFGRISKNTFFTEHFWATLLKKISVLKSLFDIFRGLKACNFN